VNNSGMTSNDAGILLVGVNNCTLDNNTFTGNRYGIFLTASFGNVIINNNFIDNAHDAYDDGINTWSKALPVGGNYWSDTELADDNENGVFDSVFSIPGGTNKDKFPWTDQNGWETFVPEKKFEINALTMMLVGMGVVFAILTVLWISTHLTGVIIQRIESKRVKPSQGGQDDGDTVAAIAAAIHTRGD
jgi:sodium pump decarboxylase gamma subunit